VTEGDRGLSFNKRASRTDDSSSARLELPIAMDGVRFPRSGAGPAWGARRFTSSRSTERHHTSTTPTGAMQEALGMVGLFIIHPRSAWTHRVDQDFALITQEF